MIDLYLKKTFSMDTDTEIGTLLKLGMYRGDKPAHFLAIKINPIVNRLLGCMKEPIKLEQHGLGYEIANRPPESAEFEDQGRKVKRRKTKRKKTVRKRK